jgi:hypothetical protein
MSADLSRIRTAVRPRDVSDDEDDNDANKSLLNSLAADLSPEKPKKQLMLLGDNGTSMTIENKKRLVQERKLRPPLKECNGPIRNMADFDKKVLVWDYDSELSELPPNINESELKPIPDYFSSVSDMFSL